MTPVDFLLGMPRSGSSWLGAQLDRAPGLAVFGETSFFGRYRVAPRGDGRYGASELARVKRVQSGRTWAATTGVPSGVRVDGPVWREIVDEAVDEGGETKPAAVFRSLAGGVARHTGASRTLEKTPHHVLAGVELATRFPEARFVVTRREPYGFVRSLHHAGRRRTRRSRVSDLQRHPALCALVWRRYAQAIDALAAYVPRRVLIVDNDSMRRRPSATIEQVAGFLGVAPPPPSEAMANSSFAGAPPPLGADEVFWVNTLLRDQGTRPVPRPRASLLTSVASLPAAAGVALLFLGRDRLRTGLP